MSEEAKDGIVRSREHASIEVSDHEACRGVAFIYYTGIILEFLNKLISDLLLGRYGRVA